MCWISDSVITPQVTKEDIPVFKICSSDIHNNIRPYYYGGKLVYEKNLTYTSKIHRFKNTSGHHEINEGLHSYSPKCIIKPYCYNEISVLSPKLLRNAIYCTYSMCVLLCVIPKGSTFFLNEKGEYVSDTLKVVKILHYDTTANVNKALNNWIHKKI